MERALPGWTATVARRPIAVPVTCAVVLAVVVWRIGVHPELAAYGYLAVVGTILAFVDVALHRLPDSLTLPSYAAGAALLGLAAPFTDGGGTRYLHALAGMATLWLVYAVQMLIAPAHIGRGDVKLAGVLGLYLGWLGARAWMAGACAGFAIAALFSIGLLLTRRATLRSEIAFGPFMLAGALVGLLLYGSG